MWQKPLVIILLFYFFALLQSSFFAHFNLFGTTPNLVFILFFVLIFFEPPTRSGYSTFQFGAGYIMLFWAFIAGFFSDVFSGVYLGPSIIIFFIAGLLLRKIRAILKSTQDPYPFGFFLPLFLVFFIGYSFSVYLFLYFIGANKWIFPSGFEFFWSTIYNLFVATIAFFLFRRSKILRGRSGGNY